MLVRYRQSLISLFKRVHELQADPIGKRLLALDIQEELLKRIGRAESLIWKTKKANKEIKAQLSRRGNSREQSNELKSRHDAGEAKLGQQRTLISVLRSIGDAIPFIYGDRWDLKRLAMKEDAGFITGKRGTRLERAILRGAFAVGATVVMNDLTHTLRYGDLTLFRPDLWPEGESPFLLIEAKTGRGGNKGRAARQKVAMEQIAEYLSNDTREVEGYLCQRVSVTQFPEYHGDTFTKLAIALPRGGRIIEEVERGLCYILLDLDACKTHNYDEVFGPLLDKQSSPMMLLRVNDMKGQHCGYYPFPLSIRDPDVLFRFYNGEFVAYVFVSMDHVNAALASDGIKIKLTHDVVNPWQILPIDEIGIGPYVTFHPLGRLASEFLRLDWLLKNTISGSTDAWQQYLAGPANGNEGMRLTPQAPGTE